jgi:hypothetical protein
MKKYAYTIELSCGEKEVGDIEARNEDEAREEIYYRFISMEEELNS